MDKATIKALGLNGRLLARLTGQTENTISRKLRRDQGLSLGPREEGVLACWAEMTEAQRKRVLERLGK